MLRPPVCAPIAFGWRWRGYWLTVIVRLPSDGADAGAAFIYSTTCSNSGLVTRLAMR